MNSKGLEIAQDYCWKDGQPKERLNVGWERHLVGVPTSLVEPNIIHSKLYIVIKISKSFEVPKFEFWSLFFLGGLQLLVFGVFASSENENPHLMPPQVYEVAQKIDQKKFQKIIHS